MTETVINPLILEQNGYPDNASRGRPPTHTTRLKFAFLSPACYFIRPSIIKKNEAKQLFLALFCPRQYYRLPLRDPYTQFCLKSNRWHPLSSKVLTFNRICLENCRFCLGNGRFCLETQPLLSIARTVSVACPSAKSAALTMRVPAGGLFSTLLPNSEKFEINPCAPGWH